MSKPRPNLFIIGAMKSGTTSLHQYLGSHPQIYMCSKPKEPNFFSQHYSKGENWYLERFASAKDALIIGESSTSYSSAPKVSGVPERIAQFNPEARFIYIMRDPIQRTISHYWHNVKRGSENRDLLAAIQENSIYLDRSNYVMQLSQYFKIFQRDRVATLTLQELSMNPLTAIKKLFDWLGVDSSFTPPNLERQNVAPSKVFRRNDSVFNNFRQSPYWKALKPLLPQPILSLAKRCTGKYVEREAVSVDAAIEFLRPIQQEQVAALSQMLGRQFPEWKTLYGD